MARKQARGEGKRRRGPAQRRVTAGASVRPFGSKRSSAPMAAESAWAVPAGFTLIELLIVVAIIAILAAIAVPNFLEAQVRSKASRARSDLRTVATALEAYKVDANHYPPNDGIFNVLPVELTTPIAYLGSSALVDPFSEHEIDSLHGALARFYSYDLIVTFEELQQIIFSGSRKIPPIEAVDSIVANPGALEKYGPWRLVSNGPDRRYRDPDYVFGSDPLDPNGVLLGADVPYDPTNGTVSKGNIVRTQKSATGRP